MVIDIVVDHVSTAGTISTDAEGTTYQTNIPISTETPANPTSPR
jgi:hypothetical protein